MLRIFIVVTYLNLYRNCSGKSIEKCRSKLALISFECKLGRIASRWKINILMFGLKTNWEQIPNNYWQIEADIYLTVLDQYPYSPGAHRAQTVSVTECVTKTVTTNCSDQAPARSHSSLRFLDLQFTFLISLILSDGLFLLDFFPLSLGKTQFSRRVYYLNCSIFHLDYFIRKLCIFGIKS